MLPAAAKSAGWSLDKMNSMYEATFNVAYIVGPGLGGLLIASVGGVNTMWVTAASFVVSIIAIALLKVDGAGKPAHETPHWVCHCSHRSPYCWCWPPASASSTARSHRSPTS
ncbi:putative drug antiporter protein precursor [Mycobacteroides abscessus subsp. abscessus]|nr:putative drug antiporter protein precursor [Mycobacteroides abscessus subsp. abscessus]